jgi:hypothetical protein
MTTPPPAPTPPEPAPPPDPQPPADPQPPEPPEPPGDPGEPGGTATLEATLERERARAKAAEAKLARLQREHMTDREKELDAARDEGRADAAKTYGKRVALAELRALLTGRVSNPAALAARIDLADHVGDDGEVDSAELAKIADELAEAAAPAANGQPRVPAGPQGKPVPPEDFLGAALRGGGR